MIFIFHKDQEHSRHGDWRALVTDTMLSIWFLLLGLLIALGLVVQHILSA